MSADVSGIVPPFYLRNGQAWVDRRESIAVSEEPLSAPVYEGGVILPLRECDDIVVADHVFEGGACDSAGAFIGGHVRAKDPNYNLSCTRAYDFDAQAVRESAERVVFGGVLYNHFGHQLVDTVSRLWYVLEPGLDGRKLAFVKGMLGKSKPISDLCRVMFSALGIAPDDVLIVEEPTRFAEVVVPDEALRICLDANVACREMFRRIRDSVEPGTCEKVFLSRKSFDKQDFVNESFLEDFYVRRGFRSVCPETLSKKEQIALLAGAREIVSTLGTMSHLATLFSRDDARLTYYVRAHEVVSQQLTLDKLCGKQPFYVDATRNILPTTHNSRAFLFGPTRCMRAYLDDTGMAYEKDELSENALPAEALAEYLRVFDRTDKLHVVQLGLNRFDMSDAVVALHEGLADEAVDPKTYRAASCRAKERAAARGRLLRAGDFADPDKGLSAVRAVACAFRDGALSLTLSGKCLAPGLDVSVVAVNAADGRREPLAQSACVGGANEASAVAEVAIDVAGFLRRHLEDAPACERWDVRVVTEEGEARVGLDEGKKPFIDFTRFFLLEDGWLLVPHLSAEGGMCFWLLGERRNDFSDDFFAARMNRPLVNDLLFRLIRAERYDTVARLFAELSRGRLRCVSLTEGTVFFEDKRYYVEPYAYAEACALCRPQEHEHVVARWQWVKRGRRLKRLARRVMRRFFEHTR